MSIPPTSNYKGRWYDGPETTSQKRAWSQDAPYSRENRDSIRSQIGQMLMIPLDTSSLNQYAIDMIQKHYVGGILLSRRNIKHPSEIKTFVHQLQFEAHKAGYALPLFIAIEQENGMLAPFGNGSLGTQFPGALATGAFRSAEILFDISKASAQELQTISVNMNLAPVLNVDEPNGMTITSRTFGDDPLNVTRCASAIIDAHKTLSIGCFVKHFPAPRHGGILELRNTVNEPRYAPFKRAFENNVDGVFLEPSMWAVSTEHTFEGKDSLAQNMIRKLFQYDGVLIGSCDRASEKFGGTQGGELAIRGLINGCDMLIVCEHPGDIQDTLEEVYTAVEMRRISRVMIEKSLDRIKRVKERYLSWETTLNPPPLNLSALMQNHRILSFRAYEMATTVVRNEQGILPLAKNRRGHFLRPGYIALLTPIAPPRFTSVEGPRQDPFEYLGRAISAREMSVKHAPYNHEGINETHSHLIAGSSIVFIVCAFDTVHERQAQLDTMRAFIRLRKDQHVVVLAACNPQELLADPHIDTLLCCYEYTREALDAAVSIIFGETRPSAVVPFKRFLASPSSHQNPLSRFQRWEVCQWEKRRDIYASADLWKKCLGRRWPLDALTLSNLLDRPGQSKHFVVKDPIASGKILGLCATYTIHAGKNLVGSLAMLMVDPEYRNRGIGMALHDEALQAMRTNPEMTSVHLGSIFPRFFPGLPVEIPEPDQAWFSRRGWKLEDNYIYDLYMDIDKWQQPDEVFGPLSVQGITFGACSPIIFDDLLAFEDKHFAAYPGWVEKYRGLKETDDIADAVLAFSNNSIVGAALVFSGVGNNQISKDIPWPRVIGERVGGLACVGMGPEYRGRGVGIGLVCAALLELKNRGLVGCFVDWSTDRAVYEKLGFATYGKYRSTAWRKL